MSLFDLWGEIWSTKPAIFWGIVGVAGKHVWDRFRGRMITLGWTTQYQHLAVSGQDERLGQIDVRWNGMPVANLRMCFVEVENESTHDLTSLVLDLKFTDGTQIWSAAGNLVGDWHNLSESAELREIAARIANLPTEELVDHPDVRLMLSRRGFHLPVLNRFSKAQFGLVVTAEPTADPQLLVSCIHPGVRVRRRSAPRWFWGAVLGVPTQRAWIVGMIAGAVVSVSVAASDVSAWVAAAVGLASGTLANVVGATVVRAWRWVMRGVG